MVDLSTSSELEVSLATAGSDGVEVLEGSVFAEALPESIASSFGQQVEADNASFPELAANASEGVVVDVLLNSELQLSAEVQSETPVARGWAEAKANAGEASSDHPTDDAGGAVVKAPLISQLETSGTEGAKVHGSSTLSVWGGDTPAGLSDSDLAGDSESGGGSAESGGSSGEAGTTDATNQTQDFNATGDRGNQAALDDTDLAEDTTDGLPGVDRGQYDEDWGTEWRADDTDHRRNYSRDEVSREERVKNSLAILGRRPQVAATAVVLAVFLATRAPRCH